jgi:hypothetical protein
MKHIVFALGFCAALFSGVASAQWQTSSLPYPHGTTFYYVSKTAGDNANDGSVNAPWKDLSFAYEEMFRDVVNTTGDPYAPAALIVEPGYYAPSNGEQFPVQMKAMKFIGGMDAHTTIVSLEDTSTSIFTFVGQSSPFAPLHPVNGPFGREDGPYLERLTLRNSLATDASNITPTIGRRGIYMDGVSWSTSAGVWEGDCSITQPTVAQLVIYGFNWGIRAHYAQPRVMDCTVVLNGAGLSTSGLPCCPDWEVVNCVVNGNTVWDLAGIGAAGVHNTNFTTTYVSSGCGFPIALPVAGIGSNPAIPYASLRFVDDTALATPGISPAPEFDFRLRVDSPLRGLGAWSWSTPNNRPLWDGEGFANLRVELTTAGNSDIGADQFNSLRMEPLTREIDPTTNKLQKIVVGTESSVGMTKLRLQVTPVNMAQSVVLAYPLIQDPSVSTQYLPIPLLDPLSFDGFLAISPIILAATAVPNTTPPAETTIYIEVPNGLPLVMQMAFVEFLPSGATHISLSNGQRLQAAL